MGIRGTVRRATDGWFVHTNVSLDRPSYLRRDHLSLNFDPFLPFQIDTDVIVWEGDSEGKHSRPSSLLEKHELIFSTRLS